MTVSPTITAQTSAGGAAEAQPRDRVVPNAKTLDEHADFLRDYVRLQLWFLWTWLSQHPDEPFRNAIRARVDIYRKTILNPGRSKNTAAAMEHADDTRWPELETEAYGVYLRLRDESADLFEHEAWPLFRPCVEARVERDFSEGDGLDDYQCGSLRYHEPRLFLSHRLSEYLSYLRHGRPRRVFFHIGNRVSPQSIFADREYLPRCFFQLMNETRTRYCAGALTTTTWLNSYPVWLALFPRQWHENLRPPRDDVNWSQAWWGQFITARGTFNHRRGAELRRTGRFAFRPRSSWCTFASLEQHLGEYTADPASEHVWTTRKRP